MTHAARKVLNDLEVAHHALESEEELDRFRVLWVSAISLSRAVGHVLHKIDSSISSAMKEAIRKAYESWSNNREKNQIYFEFIESERNSVLKEYEFGFLSGPINVLAFPETQVFHLSANLYVPLMDGPYSGEDCLDVLREAINWWSTQLAEIDRVSAT